MEELEFIEKVGDDDIEASLLEGRVRDFDIEDLGIKMLASKVKTCISEEEIRNTLLNNGFNGIYALPNDMFRQLKENECVNGYYDHVNQRIVINRDYYKDNKDVVVHELLHAYLNCNSRAFVQVDDAAVPYGNGLEEGCCAIIQKVNSINNIDDCVVDGYRYQANLVKQLNVLYKNSPNKKYPNLLHHLLKEPNDFLPAVARLYEGILSKLSDDIEINVSDIGLRSALSVVTVTDSMVEDKEYGFKYMYSICSAINAIYLCLAKKNIRDDKDGNNLFPYLNQVTKTKEDRLLELLLNNDNDYVNRQIDNLSNLLMDQQEELEIYSESKILNYKSLVRK